MSAPKSIDHSVWRNSDFRLLLSGQLVSSIGDQLQNLAIPLLALYVTGSATQAGLILGLHTAAYLAFGLVAGALADRWNRKTTMIWCEVGRALLTASIPVALYLHALSGAQLYAVAMLTGVFTTLFQAANNAALPNVVRPSELPSALASMQSSFSAIGIAGGALAGLAYALGRTVPFVVNVVSFGISAITLRSMRAQFQEQRADRPGKLAAEIRAGLTWVGRAPVIRFLTIVQGADNLRYGSGYLLIILLAERVGSSSWEIGLIFSGAAIGALLGSLASGRIVRRFPLGRVAVVMLWIEAIAFPFYAIAPNTVVLGAIALIESVVAPMYAVAMNTYRLAITPDSLRGRVTGAVNTVATGALSVGAMIGGVLVSTVGAQRLAVLSGGWLLVLAVLTTANRTVRQAPVAASVLPSGSAETHPHPPVDHAEKARDTP